MANEMQDNHRVRVVQRRLRDPLPEQVRPARGQDHALSPRRPLPGLQGGNSKDNEYFLKLFNMKSSIYKLGSYDIS